MTTITCNFDTLEVGGIYLNRIGQLVEITENIHETEYLFEGYTTEGDRRTFTESGKYHVIREMDDEDLVYRVDQDFKHKRKGLVTSGRVVYGTKHPTTGDMVIEVGNSMTRAEWEATKLPEQTFMGFDADTVQVEEKEVELTLGELIRFLKKEAKE